MPGIASGLKIKKPAVSKIRDDRLTYRGTTLVDSSLIMSSKLPA